mgnify:FL=1|tara:strand:+ start:93 stop:242 length:150 start_codon:yes stop_codon:yes gene_type:complete
MKTFQIVETAESTYEDPIYQVTFKGVEYPPMTRSECRFFIEKVDNKIAH